MPADVFKIVIITTEMSSTVHPSLANVLCSGIVVYNPFVLHTLTLKPTVTHTHTHTHTHTPDTDNDLAASSSDGGYSNITVAYQPAPPTLDFLQFIHQQIEPGETSADCILLGRTVHLRNYVHSTCI